MDKLIGRNIEIQKLTEYYNSQKSEFIAVYGRRRVGKTFLVNSVFKDKCTFEVTGIIGGSRKDEMDSFYSALMSYGYKGHRPENWMQMFDALKSLLMTSVSKRKVLFMDELPCFDTPKSGFVRALDFFWNSWASKRDDIMLIVCGSATSWIVKNIIDNHGGLHNRITHELYLKPFTLKEVDDYLKSRGSKWKRLSVLQTYMILGGVPYYLSLLDVTQSLHENIDRLFFSENAELKREYNRLYKSLYGNPEKYMDIVKALSAHKQGLTRNELAEVAGVGANGHLTNILDDLEKCGFIRYYSVPDKVSGGIYQLVDFYSLFYHAFGKKRTTDIHYWSHLINTPKQNSWFGLAYEKVCMAHIQQILYALHLDKIHTEYYSWRSKKSEKRSQIDLIIDRADNVQNICEIKYSQNEYALNKTEYQKIMDRCEIFSTETQSKKGIHVTMITIFGLKKNTYSDIAQSEVTMDDLFAF
ncbi:MAG: ATP-binding protein [Bacteroidales bacterium]|nr:ATP-binding protein [Bacteroidales bacterium]